MAPPVCYPQVGTWIDDGRFQLVSLLGTGGYGKVYKAFNPMHEFRPYYAVKCLPRTSSPEHHQLHIREITLHQRVSSHPGVVRLLRVIEDNEFIYLVMDYAPDQDLFTQILDKRRYLGNDILIRSTFLQILDVVEHCHSMGVYHRDLKPENFVCFSGGLEVGLTDFGLATTERTSTEFKTGSVYHMSPECQAAEMSCGGIYSPQACDIWSLGIILLNLVTGRNPWNCAKWEDATFRSYHQNPYTQLPDVLPISAELNEVLIGMLSMEWRARPSIGEIRDAVKGVTTFYSRDVVFDGNVAKFLWESERDKKKSVRRQAVELPVEDPSRRPCERKPPNDIRTKIFKQKFPAFEEEDSDGSQTSNERTGPHPPPGYDDSDSSSSSSNLSSTGSDSVVVPSSLDHDKRVKVKSRTSFRSLLSGFRGLFRVRGGKLEWDGQFYD